MPFAENFILRGIKSNIHSKFAPFTVIILDEHDEWCITHTHPVYFFPIIMANRIGDHARFIVFELAHGFTMASNAVNAVREALGVSFGDVGVGLYYTLAVRI